MKRTVPHSPTVGANRRRGSALMQMAVTMTVMSTLMTVSGTALVRMYRQQGRQLERLAATNNWQRLSRDFRSDMHAARGVTRTDDAPQRLVIALESESVTWFIHGDEVRRVKTDAENVAADADQTLRIAGESYAFPDTSIEFEITQETTQAELAAIVITPEPDAATQHPSTRIEASVGRDRQFAASSEQTTAEGRPADSDNLLTIN